MVLRLIKIAVIAVLFWNTGIQPGVAAPHADIFLMKELLAKNGFYAGSINNKMDREGREALQRAQRFLGLPADGVFDMKIAGQLQKLLGEKPVRYKKKFIMSASAYTARDPGCTGITKGGHPLRRGLVAVDPRLIPLGSRLYVEGYGYAVADDVGSAIRGLKIDLAFEKRSEAFQFGRKTVWVYVLE